MRFWIEGPRRPRVEELAAFGLEWEGEDDAEYEVWPDNWPVLDVFLALNTQWQMSDAGAVGLRYEVLPFVFDTYRVKKKDRADMLHDLKTCERTALDCWSKKRG